MQFYVVRHPGVGMYETRVSYKLLLQYLAFFFNHTTTPYYGRYFFYSSIQIF